MFAKPYCSFDQTLFSTRGERSAGKKGSGLQVYPFVLLVKPFPCDKFDNNDKIIIINIIDIVDAYNLWFMYAHHLIMWAVLYMDDHKHNQILFT